MQNLIQDLTRKKEIRDIKNLSFTKTLSFNNDSVFFCQFLISLIKISANPIFPLFEILNNVKKKARTGCPCYIKILNASEKHTENFIQTLQDMKNKKLDIFDMLYKAYQDEQVQPKLWDFIKTFKRENINE
jgi:hypothetical protein